MAQLKPCSNLQWEMDVAGVAGVAAVISIGMAGDSVRLVTRTAVITSAV